MYSDKIEYFRQLLLKQKRDIEQTINTMKKNNTGTQGEYYPTELSSYDNHPAEIGTDLFGVEMNTALKVHEEHLLKEIHDALGRIDDGSFGKCEFCGNEISEERLEALPYARLCIDCEENKAIDPEILANSRPNEERVLDAPLGRKYLNQREDDEYEGLDQFYDLMKYGSSDSPQDLGGYHEYEEYYTNETDKQGIVDDMDDISNEEYKRQLP
ncbi:MAG TPA: conjugal transfer protein TraR [Clostridiaceae bacterium]|nr:conjugal transfer protein TraR [Clostridiaceae bacterium]